MTAASMPAHKNAMRADDMGHGMFAMERIDGPEWLESYAMSYL
jgi:hypothetical protein